MNPTFQFFPDQASETARHVDHLSIYLVTVAIFFSTLIFSLILLFAIKYRRRSDHDRTGDISEKVAFMLEMTWTIIPFGLMMVMFGWGASIFFEMSRPPDDAMNVYVVGKQWMWKTQHLGGQREINELHVPLGRSVKLTMTSEDVIHSFYVPAFRVKFDVLPGRYTTAWFNPTKPGKYHLFCAEYCGTLHSGMIGSIYVMEPAEYETWLAGGAGGESLAANGQKLFEYLACANCHRTDKPGRCPNLMGLFGKPVQLTTGEAVKADEAYIRESILNPGAKIVAGYQNIMPSFQGLVTEEDLLQLIEYIKALGAPPGQQGAPTGGAIPAGLERRGTTGGPAGGSASVERSKSRRRPEPEQKR
jgi:cytochrome c oxidase subunit II